MEKTKSFDEKVCLSEEKERRAKRIFSVIEWILFILIGVGFFINLKFGVISVVFFLWSEYWYSSGCNNLVTEEFEQDGYPTEGLSWMFKSWIFFAIIASIIVYFFL